MRIFGKERESLRVKKVKAARAVFIDQDTQEVDLSIITEDGERLDLHLNPRHVHAMILELTNAYEAINPPLRSGSYQSQWQGMDDQS